MIKKFTDIVRDGWVERVPENWRPYVHLARLDRPIGVWLLLFPGLWSIALASGGIAGIGFYQVYLIILFAIGAIVMRSAGCVVNDLWDRDLDSKVERTQGRPLASGDLSMKQGFLFLCALLLVGFLILIQLNGMAIILGLVSLPLVFLYPLMKRITYWPQAFLGLTFNFGALMGWAAVSESLSLASFMLYVGGIFWTIGYDTIYAHQDKEDDALIGVRSTALIFGARSKDWISTFYSMSCVFIGGAMIVAHSGFIATALCIVVMAVHFVWQINSWKIDDPSSSLKVFKANRNFGFYVFLAALLSGLLV